MMPNSSGTVRGSNFVPNHSPRLEQQIAASGDEREQHRPVHVQVHLLGGHDGGDREHEHGRDQALDRPGHDLLEGDQIDRQGSRHAVLDLPGVAELLHERQRDGLDALEHDRQAQHAGDEGRGVDAARPRRSGRSPIFGYT